LKGKQLTIWMIAGFVMSIGMSYGGMAHVSSLNFFDPFATGENHLWDLSMLILFCAALLPTFFYWQLVGKRTRKPLLDSEWHLPTNTVVDRKLVLGSLIFGAGWALGGFCPGPSVSGLVTGHPNFVAFSYGMYAYFLGYHLRKARKSGAKPNLLLTLLLGAVPGVLYLIGPTLFPVDGVAGSTQWPLYLSMLGGLGIAVASVSMFAFNGRVLGLCGLWRTLLDVGLPASSRLPQVLFFIAFMAGGVVTCVLEPASFASPPYLDRNLGWIVLGGVLTAHGTTWANGCTSGHGVSGLSRLSVRSLVAVAVFMGGVFVFLPLFNLLLGAG
jgi:uncharacterized membrane protein YedE/YeeE